MRSAMVLVLRLAIALATAAAPVQSQTASNPHGPSIGACITCHRADSWRPAQVSRDFRHAEKVFPLDGAHQRTACTACHISLDFSKASTSCAQCHRDVHKSELGSDCARCHTTRSFVDQTNLKRMHEMTRFPLRGAHAPLACEACHTGAQPGQSQYVRRPTTCISCHMATYRAALSPDHQAAQFSQDCAQCHAQTAWSGGKFDHSTTKFALQGAHTAVACQSCHSDGVFRGRAATCISCHQADYTWSKTPPHAAGFPRDCLACHTVARWQGATFDHDKSGFPLTGAHRAAICSSCHADNVFKGRASTCLSCHKRDFDVSARPPHSQLGFSSACSTCHTTVAWAGGTFDHNATAFPLTGSHRTATCANCHADGVYRGRPSTCVACHQQKYTATTTPPHAASAFPTTCQQCHGTTTWLGAPYDHALTAFPLSGAHSTVRCSSCHGDGVYRGKSSACISCHQAAYTATLRPPHSQLGFSPACSTCHTMVTWAGGSFDHNTTTFPLTGAHRTATCANCHADGVYRGRPSACVACHQQKYTATTTPPHTASGFPTSCQQCHGTTTWLGSTYDHALTAFPLTGAHRTASCANCHGDGVYRGKSTACQSCHQAAYTASLHPPHSQLGFSAACSTCHTTTAWAGGTFDHNATAFPLTGAHRTATCANCHADGVYRGRPSTCAACHQQKYAATTTPPHAASGYPTTCQQCHGTSSWLGSGFDHSTTLFPLAGAHRTAPCSSCHGDGVYKGKSTACQSCHQAAYTASLHPPHSQLGFSAVCSTCHTTTAWAGGTFDHNATAFPLTGAHRTATCANCHADGVYRGRPSTCAACHQQKYTATTTPPHAASGYPTTCQQCHGTSSWLGSGFDHSTTLFPLAGAHRTAPCSSCHGDGVYKGKSTACQSCHQAAYTASRHPPHSQLGFSAVCSTCHTTTAWAGGTFDHNATAFPLTGAHRTATCANCHADGVYRGRPSTCAACHQQKYTATTTPPHVASGFPTTCQQCHGTTTWLGSSYDHALTAFPLVGAHRTVPCSSCHGDGVFKGKSTACLSCHQTAFTATLRPPHSQLGFSAVCTTCHTMTTWAGGTFDHNTTRFALAGAHRAVACSGCHGDGVYRGKSMLCATCHLARYTAATTPPHASAGFPTTCEVCHGTTAWTPATFNHQSTRFPLTGAHVSKPCASCHGDGVYRGKVMTCVGCHLATYNATTNPNHKAANFPTACESCHTTTRWTGATFNHDASFFPIYSGAHKGRWTTCANCHTVSTNYASFSCFSCHRQTEMDSKHRGRTGYRYDSVLCYQCHPRGKKP